MGFEALLARSIQIVAAVGGAYFVALWFALVVWTFQDIQTRSRSVIAQIFSTLTVVLFSVPGVLIYLILRPRETLDDAFQRSLEEEYLLQDLEDLSLCPSCQRHVQDEFVFCPMCRAELRQACASCDRMIDLRWDICPYCGTDQYPQERVAYGSWEPERSVVGSPGLIHHAQERFAVQRDQTASMPEPQEPLRAPETESIETEPAAYESEPAAYEPSEYPPVVGWRGPNGHTHTPFWDDDSDQAESGRSGTTDELPTGTPYPPR